jgi:hypothetical protein
MKALLIFVMSAIKLLSVTLVVYWLGEELLLNIHTGWTFPTVFLGVAIFGFLLDLNTPESIRRRLDNNTRYPDSETVELVVIIVTTLGIWLSYLIVYLIYFVIK